MSQAKNTKANQIFKTLNNLFIFTWNIKWKQAKKKKMTGLTSKYRLQQYEKDKVQYRPVGEGCLPIKQKES